jgi:hypothetical protein
MPLRAIVVVAVALSCTWPSPATDPQMTALEARRIINAILPPSKGEPPIIELDREHDGCVVYHVYRLSLPQFAGDQQIHTNTFGWWSIDTRTAEVWDVHEARVESPKLVLIQQSIRKRLRVTSDEQKQSISKPCDEREFSK